MLLLVTGNLACTVLCGAFHTDSHCVLPGLESHGSFTKRSTPIALLEHFAHAVPAQQVVSVSHVPVCGLAYWQCEVALFWD